MATVRGIGLERSAARAPIVGVIAFNKGSAIVAPTPRRKWRRLSVLDGLDMPLLDYADELVDLKCESTYSRSVSLGSKDLAIHNQVHQITDSVPLLGGCLDDPLYFGSIGKT